MRHFTRCPCENPKPEDLFSRIQIIQYLEEIPLGYRTEEEHRFAESLILNVERHFAELDNSWKPSID